MLNRTAVPPDRCRARNGLCLLVGDVEHMGVFSGGVRGGQAGIHLTWVGIGKEITVAFSSPSPYPFPPRERGHRTVISLPILGLRTRSFPGNTETIAGMDVIIMAARSQCKRQRLAGVRSSFFERALPACPHWQKNRPSTVAGPVGGGVKYPARYFLVESAETGVGSRFRVSCFPWGRSLAENDSRPPRPHSCAPPP
jgi:hypothetical protein